MKKIINIMCIDVAKRNLCTFILIFGLILTIALSMGIAVSYTHLTLPTKRIV